ncbi:MAG: hypothetical protein Kow0058_10180 [Roseovarius sp.]
MQEVVIAGAARTPMGGFQGDFNGVEAPVLGGVAIRAALADAGAESAGEVVMGCVLPAGQGQAPARQAAFLAGLGEDVPATTLNKMCGSGMKAAMVGFDQIALGATDTMIAGGMESMSMAPYLLPKMRGGARLGHAEAKDHMFLDGLEDAYDKGRLMAPSPRTAPRSISSPARPRTNMRSPPSNGRSRRRNPAPSPQRSRPSPSGPATARPPSARTNSPARRAPRRSRS